MKIILFMAAVTGGQILEPTSYDNRTPLPAWPMQYDSRCYSECLRIYGSTSKQADHCPLICDRDSAEYRPTGRFTDPPLKRK